MRRSVPRAFWLSFFLTLAILMPLLGAFVFYSAWQERASEPAARSQSGVTVQRPTSANDLTVLVARGDHEFVTLSLKDLLPYSFDSSYLE